MSTTVIAEDQDVLIKSLNDIDLSIKNKHFRDRNLMNLILIIFAIILGPILFIASLILGQIEFMPPLMILTFILVGVSSCIAAYYNKTWGFLIVSLQNLVLNLFISYVNPNHYSEFITLVDGITVFVFATEFFLQGYIVAMTIMLLKMLYFTLLVHPNRDLQDFLASIITFSTLGLIPVLIHMNELTKMSEKKNKFRAEILALQNQELLQSWQKFFNKDKQGVVPEPETTISAYTSPYEAKV